MPDPANIQVRDGLKTLLEEGGRTVIVDRDTDAEPIQPEERPCIVVRITDVTLDERQEMGGGCQQHVATIAMDHYDDTDTAEDINSSLSASIAETIALIGTDPHVGNKVVELTAVSADANSDNVPDVGCATLTMQARYFTKLFDWTTIVF
jgi:hypothetical protein